MNVIYFILNATRPRETLLITSIVAKQKSVRVSFKYGIR